VHGVLGDRLGRVGFLVTVLKLVPRVDGVEVHCALSLKID
jgi:hypothetical protein